MQVLQILSSNFPIRINLENSPLQHAKILGGAMDERAWLWSKYLLGNNKDIISYEITLGNSSFKVLIDGYICITGAQTSVKINGNLQPLWQVLLVKTGDIIEIFYPKYGVRNYLSMTTHHNNFKFMPTKFIPEYSKSLVLKILINRYDNNFSVQDIDYFLNKKWQISKLNNRQAYRLEKSNLAPLTKKMLSQGNSFGSVQITSGGEPIIMHKDAPTIGGYNKIGTIFSLDMFKLSQKTTGDDIQFEEINIQNMQKEKLVFDKFFQK